MKDNIPIKEFLDKQFLSRGDQLVPKRVDGESVVRKVNTSAYASQVRAA